MSQHTDRDYVLGTHDEEVARLGLQHQVWRARAVDAWTRAGIASGQTVLDVGAGPGFASCGLAELVGPAGRVIALERSQRLLAVLQAERERRHLSQIVTHELDLDEAELPVASFGEFVRVVMTSWPIGAANPMSDATSRGGARMPASRWFRCVRSSTWSLPLT